MISPRAKNRMLWLSYGLVMMAFFAVMYAIYRDHHKLWFCDALDYAAGLKEFAAGQDAYGVAPGLTPTGFIYSPLVLKLAGVFVRIVPHPLLWKLYAGLIYVAILPTPWLLSRMTGRGGWFSPTVAALIFLAEPYLLSIHEALGANVSFVMYALLLLALIPSWRSAKWSLFYVAVFLTSLIKPSFLTFLLLPLFAASGQAVLSAITTLAVAAVYLFQRLVAPNLYAAFQESVRVELIGQKDYGLGIFCFLYEHAHSRLAFMQWTGSLVAHILVMTGIIGLLWRARPLRREPGLVELWLPALNVIAVLADPRPHGYDLYLAWVPAVFIVAEWLRTATHVASRIAAFVLVIAVEALLYTSDPEMVYTGFLVAALALVFQRAWSLRSRPVALAVLSTV